MIDGNKAADEARRRQKAIPANWPLALALVLMLVGGVATAVSDVVDVPATVGLLVLALFFGGALVALVLAYREARASHVSMPRAIGRALKTGLGWFFYFL
jgi:hypothetical protein